LGLLGVFAHFYKTVITKYKRMSRPRIMTGISCAFDFQFIIFFYRPVKLQLYNHLKYTFISKGIGVTACGIAIHAHGDPLSIAY